MPKNFVSALLFFSKFQPKLISSFFLQRRWKENLDLFFCKYFFYALELPKHQIQRVNQSTFENNFKRSKRLLRHTKFYSELSIFLELEEQGRFGVVKGFFLLFVWKGPVKASDSWSCHSSVVKNTTTTITTANWWKRWKWPVTRTDGWEALKLQFGRGWADKAKWEKERDTQRNKEERRE